LRASCNIIIISLIVYMVVTQDVQPDALEQIRLRQCHWLWIWSQIVKSQSTDIPRETKLIVLGGCRAMNKVCSWLEQRLGEAATREVGT
jgi:hypothetical protein